MAADKNLNNHQNNDPNNTQRIRLDKWLWAARFFKTRSLCKTAIDGSKVQYVVGEEKTQKVKANKLVNLGDVIEIKQGWDSKTIIVDALSDKRGKAAAAETLYHETKESLAKRNEQILIRQAAKESVVFDTKKPDKRDRRRIFKFNETNNS